MPQGDITFIAGNAPIAVAATSSPGTTIYTAVSGSAQIDAVHIVASNIDASSTIDLTLEIGGTVTSSQLWFQLRPKSTIEIPILKLNGGAVVKTFAGSANKINCIVDSNRYTL